MHHHARLPLGLPRELDVEERPFGLNPVKSRQEFKLQQRTLLLRQSATPAPQYSYDAPDARPTLRPGTDPAPALASAACPIAGLRSADGVNASGYLRPMKLILLLVALLAVIGAVAFMRTGRGSRGTRRVRDGRHRPMTEWAEEQEVDTPPSGASVEREAEPENPSRP